MYPKIAPNNISEIKSPLILPLYFKFPLSVEKSPDIVKIASRRGKIEKPYAERLRKQLEKKGVRSFGSKKENNYYFKHRNSQKSKSDG